MCYKAIVLLLLATPAWAAEVPDQFTDTFAAIKWACDHVNESPSVACIETPDHQVIVLWGVPNKSGETPVLTLVKNKVDAQIPFVRFESLDAWPIDLEGEPTEHFGLIRYDEENDLITYHTNVKRQLLIQSFGF